MRPVYVAGLFLLVALILFVSTLKSDVVGQRTREISKKVRRRTSVMFLFVSVGLIAVDYLTR